MMISHYKSASINQRAEWTQKFMSQPSERQQTSFFLLKFIMQMNVSRVGDQKALYVYGWKSLMVEMEEKGFISPVNAA